ncbi:MAG: hypothetical protein MZU95_01195 [Desulfomicrobium escambiense]|nr:hypothetical protein [Desulfomicrobium escambiense]
MAAVANGATPTLADEDHATWSRTRLGLPVPDAALRVAPSVVDFLHHLRRRGTGAEENSSGW